MAVYNMYIYTTRSDRKPEKKVFFFLFLRILHSSNIHPSLTKLRLAVSFAVSRLGTFFFKINHAQRIK